MECAIVNAVVGKMVELLTGCFLTSTGRQIGHVVHYKKNMDDLDAKVENLRGLRDKIKEKVVTAENSAEVIEEAVSQWLTDVSKKEEDLERILVDKRNIKSCFNVCSRYRLSKEGKELSSGLSGLIDVGDKFETVAHPAIWYTATTNFEQFESRLSVHEQIIQALTDHKNYYIGIHGMPGTGKTRMVEEIAKQAKKNNFFDEVAKAVFSQTPNLEKIQKELADCLNLSFNTDTEVGRKGELSNRLKRGKKILVVIDDIWDDFELEKIGIPSNDNHIKGCKVLLTSRREDVFIKMGVLKRFPIGLLQQDEAWILFKKTVGDFIESPHEIHSVAKQVCGECGRLPLAILVVGASLRDQKEKPAWDDALSQLNNCRGDNIEGIYEKLYSRIEWSYNYLKQTDVKSCFLRCSMYPEDFEIPIDDLVMYGVGTRFLEDSSYTMKTARDRIHVLVGILKRSHLLLEGKSKEFVKMHDIIRDVAITFASREGFLAKIGVPRWPEKDEYESRKVISLISENICVLPCQLECPELRTLLLACRADPKAQVPDSFFKRTEKVEVLDLYLVQLPSSLLNLVNLRMLRLYGCEKVNLASLKKLRNLEILSIADSDLKEMAVEVGQLTGLRWLDLRKCEKLEMIPSGVIKGLSNMEELYIPPNFVGWGDEGSVGLDELKSLTHLTTLQIHIGDGMVLPNELSFELLNRFKISVGRTQGFEYGEENLGARILRLDSVTLRKEFNVLMEKAEVLFLSSLKGLKNVLHYGDGKGFLDLKYLQIRDCSDMEHLLGRLKRNLQTQGSFCKLSVLIVEGCTWKFLFYSSTARALPQLQKLHISGCRIMEEIILEDEEVMDKDIFHQLKKMRLYDLPILRSICSNTKKTSTTECNTSALAQALFNEKVSFPALEKLRIEKLESITAIWENQLFQGSEAKEKSFQQVSRITIEECKKLVNVIPSTLISRLQNLEILSVNRCDSVVSLVEVRTVEKGSATRAPEIELPRLKSMYLESLPMLMLMGLNRKEHPDHRLGAYSNLTSLRIRHCHSLRNVFSSSMARNLGQLQDLAVIDCACIEEIIAFETGEGKEEVRNDEIIVFPQLSTMSLLQLSNLKSFCGSKKAAVDDDNIPQVEALFNYKVAFPVLEHLALSDGSIFEDICYGRVPAGSFGRVRVLKVYQWDMLVNVSALLQRFEVVEELTLLNCSSLEVVFNLEGLEDKERGATMSSQITKLQLDHLPKLVHLGIMDSQGLLAFHDLRSLIVVSCDSLKYLFSLSMARNLTNIEHLIVADCAAIEEIIKNEDQSGKDDDMDEIVFPKLQSIELCQLANLTSFCWANNAVKMPSLQHVRLNKCPKMHTFTSGRISTPVIEVFKEMYGSEQKVSDLNNYYVQQHLQERKGNYGNVFSNNKVAFTQIGAPWNDRLPGTSALSRPKIFNRSILP
ncbi:probable disease resistance protein At4g27220 isoform X2 [Cornus florida]|uniref:probable disease resistance protein At4g27220 isoform X2 n=1 Tax=Cornus florida TaxID=4283 RepID=UPI00289CDC6D|nr:probable disease resistance protein At4g27220 isoform X2 [Cornus florida]